MKDKNISSTDDDAICLLLLGVKVNNNKFVSVLSLQYGGGGITDRSIVCVFWSALIVELMRQQRSFKSSQLWKTTGI